jgi:hypothetical protein
MSTQHNQINEFYFMHTTTVFENLLDVLRTDIIYPGKDVRPEQRQHYRINPSDYVYANIYFEDLGNIKATHNYTLLLHPKIMYQNGFFFNKGWQKIPYRGPNVPNIDAITLLPINYPQPGIEISDTDNQQQTNDKLKQIHDFLKNPTLPRQILGLGILEHEILFDHPIDLTNGNLIGIVCGNCNMFNDQLDLIRETIKDKSYHGAKIITAFKNALPKFTELIG